MAPHVGGNAALGERGCADNSLPEVKVAVGVA